MTCLYILDFNLVSYMVKFFQIAALNFLCAKANLWAYLKVTFY